jgi:hypothetical protein
VALHVSLTCQSEHIAQSIIYTLWRRLFLVALSLEKDRTYLCVTRPFGSNVTLCETYSNELTEQNARSLACKTRGDCLHSLRPLCGRYYGGESGLVPRIACTLFHVNVTITAKQPRKKVKGSTLHGFFRTLLAMSFRWLMPWLSLDHHVIVRVEHGPLNNSTFHVKAVTTECLFVLQSADNRTKNVVCDGLQSHVLYHAALPWCGMFFSFFLVAGVALSLLRRRNSNDYL